MWAQVLLPRTPAARLGARPDVAHPPPLRGPCLGPPEPDWLTGPHIGALAGVGHWDLVPSPLEHLGAAVCILPQRLARR